MNRKVGYFSVLQKDSLPTTLAFSWGCGLTSLNKGMTFSNMEPALATVFSLATQHKGSKACIYNFGAEAPIHVTSSPRDKACKVLN